ncbi:MAG: hypothetical protein KDB50_02270 [Mycobacterium sp.]|nr:hypothetical protein [Mycobacterium sp.]
MPGLAEVALGAAPIAGGAMLGALAGTFKGPDFRGLIKSDLDLLDRIPEDNVELRAALRRSIDARITELIANVDRSRELRQAASSYQGNWRDIVLFVCAALFSVVWWNVPHDRTNWLVTFVFLLILTAVVGLYAARGLLRAFGRTRHRN